MKLLYSILLIFLVSCNSLSTICEFRKSIPEGIWRSGSSTGYGWLITSSKNKFMFIGRYRHSALNSIDVGEYQLFGKKLKLKFKEGEYAIHDKSIIYKNNEANLSLEFLDSNTIKMSGYTFTYSRLSKNVTKQFEATIYKKVSTEEFIKQAGADNFTTYHLRIYNGKNKSNKKM